MCYTHRSGGSRPRARGAGAVLIYPPAGFFFPSSFLFYPKQVGKGGGGPPGSFPISATSPASVILVI